MGVARLPEELARVVLALCDLPALATVITSSKGGWAAIAAENHFWAREAARVVDPKSPPAPAHRQLVEAHALDEGIRIDDQSFDTRVKRRGRRHVLHFGVGRHAGPRNFVAVMRSRSESSECRRHQLIRGSNFDVSTVRQRSWFRGNGRTNQGLNHSARSRPTMNQTECIQATPNRTRTKNQTTTEPDQNQNQTTTTS